MNTDDFTKVNDVTSEFDQDDIQHNKGMAIISYIWILVIITIICAPNSKFARFHANQGLVLFITKCAMGIAFTVAGNFPGYSIFPISVLLSTLQYIMNILLLICAIVGIVYAARGEAKELPIIGSIKILK